MISKAQVMALVAGDSWLGKGDSLLVFGRRPGRTEYFPARISALSPDGIPILDRLGNGGSARLAPLVAADGLGVIPARAERHEPGASLGFLPFEEALRL
jgi:molybdopterin molybdotransferase